MRVDKNGNLSWLYGYAPTNSTEYLIDFKLNDSNLISSFRSQNGSVLISHNLNDGSEKWKFENNRTPVDFEVYDSKVYLLSWGHLSIHSVDDGSLIEEKNLNENFVDIQVDKNGLLIVKEDKAIYLNKSNLDEIFVEKDLDNSLFYGGGYFLQYIP